MAFIIERGDLTTYSTDAIVNAANTQLLAGGGICGQIFAKAGYNDLQQACDALSPIKVGEAVLTPAFNLKAKYIIHAVGPVYYNGEQNEAKLLYNAYANSLKLAKKYSLKSIAFPLISTGIFGYPKKEALSIATKAISDFLKDNEMDIYLVIYYLDDLEIPKK